MSKPKKDLSKEKEANLCEMFDYLCSKIDFGHSFLDATAIVCMNKLFIELKKLNNKYPLK